MCIYAEQQVLLFSMWYGTKQTRHKITKKEDDAQRRTVIFLPYYIAKLIQENEFEFDAINMGKFHSQINVKHAAMQHFSQTTVRTYQDRE